MLKISRSKFAATAVIFGTVAAGITMGAGAANASVVGITASSTWSADYAASNAIDDNPNTRWSSAAGGYQQSLILDLGSQRSWRTLAIDWEAAYASTYTLSQSSDQQAWYIPGAGSNVYQGANGTTVAQPIDGGFARYIKITMNPGPHSNVSIWDIRVDQQSNFPKVRSVNASSTWSADYAASNAIDGNPNTRWSSAAGGYQQSLILDLGFERSWRTLAIDWEAAYASTYTLAQSSNQQVWTIPGAGSNVYQGANGTTVARPVDGGFGRYIKITMNPGPHSNVSIWDIRVDGVAYVATASSATASSVFDSSYAASNAIDGDPNTRWASAANGKKETLVIDLGSVRQFDNLAIDWQDAYASSYTVYVSYDNQRWASGYNGSTTFAGAKGTTVANMANTQARYIKIEMNPGPYSLVSIWGVKAI